MPEPTFAEISAYNRKRAIEKAKPEQKPKRKPRAKKDGDTNEGSEAAEA